VGVRLLGILEKKGALNTKKSHVRLPHSQSYKILMVHHFAIGNTTKITIILKVLFTLCLITVSRRLFCYVSPQFKRQLFNSCEQGRHRTAAIFESSRTEGRTREVHTKCREKYCVEHRLLSLSAPSGRKARGSTAASATTTTNINTTTGGSLAIWLFRDAIRAWLFYPFFSCSFCCGQTGCLP
jgi:hypothetical protein